MPDGFDRLVAVIAALREHCPWMAALSHESLIEYLIEETYEVVEAVETGLPPDELRGELGDVLLQVVLHARLAEEQGQFGIADVVEGLTRKMIRRNPHVFRADGSLQDEFPASVAEIVAKWQQVKAAENPERGRFEGIPASLPALALAQKTLRRAGGVAAAGEATEAGLGDALFELLRANPELDAERALRGAVRRFQAEHAG
ncbi:MAG: nucleotide pyrophosphohydrolase [Renibacterium sp.]|nr:nucleotide pyrophosphohydrolase [Renibacterium sp.]